MPVKTSYCPVPSRLSLTSILVSLVLRSTLAWRMDRSFALAVRVRVPRKAAVLAGGAEFNHPVDGSVEEYGTASENYNFTIRFRP